MKIGPTLLVTLVLFGCAKDKADDAAIDKNLTPHAAVNDLTNNQGATSRGHRVRWGGVVIGSKNLKDHTQLEVLSYPLDRNGRPKRDSEPLGRFIATKDGYLETVDYAPGRLVTITGPVQTSETRKLGESDYDYPLIAVDDLKLWEQDVPRTEPRFHFGIGIGIGHSF